MLTLLMLPFQWLGHILIFIATVAAGIYKIFQSQKTVQESAVEAGTRQGLEMVEGLSNAINSINSASDTVASNASKSPKQGGKRRKKKSVKDIKIT